MNGATVHMKLEVEDFARFYETFFAAGNVHRRHQLGLVSAELFRDERSPNLVLAVLEWSSAAGARAYFDDLQLLARMAAAGVVGVPEIRFVRRVSDASAAPR